MATVTIEQLWIYPVKSLAGISLTSATLKTAGLARDREWMIVDGDGLFLSQRKLPRMATIKTEFQNGQLTLLHKRTGELPLTPPDGDARPVQVQGSHCFGFAAPKEASQWLQQALEIDDALQLVYFDKSRQRPTHPERFGPYHTYFSDGAPFLVANQASLKSLNKQLLLEGKATVDVRRFRPNIVISGLEAFAEHHCRQLRHPASGSTLALKDHCKRCSIITVDPNTGTASPDQHPFLSLAQINGMPDKPKAPAFGVNTVLTEGAGSEIRCGDEWVVE
jgi:uncharacterized protein YcbX